MASAAATEVSLWWKRNETEKGSINNLVILGVEIKLKPFFVPPLVPKHSHNNNSSSWWHLMNFKRWIVCFNSLSTCSFPLLLHLSVLGLVNGKCTRNTFISSTGGAAAVVSIAWCLAGPEFFSMLTSCWYMCSVIQIWVFDCNRDKITTERMNGWVGCDCFFLEIVII